MYNISVVDVMGNPVTSVEYSTQEYPYSATQKLYLQNNGSEDLRDIRIAVKPALSVVNFSTPALITEAKISSVFNRVYFNYAELLFIEDNVVVDIANFPGKKITPIIDSDGYCRNILKNVAILFSHMLHNGNSRIYLSEAHYMAGVSEDTDGSAVGYQREYYVGDLLAGEQVAFWYKFFLRKDMTGEKNPYKFNILIKGA